MKSFFSKSIQYGIIAGVILVFSELVNLTSTFAIILEKLFNSAKTGKTASPVAILVLTGAVVFLIAYAFLRKKNENRQLKSGQVIGAGILVGLTAGLILSLFGYGVVCIVSIYFFATGIICGVKKLINIVTTSITENRQLKLLLNEKTNQTKGK